MTDILIGEQDSSKALTIGLELSVARSRRDDEPMIRTYVRYLTHHVGYTGVMMRESDGPTLVEETREWKLMSYHDSCWRWDGIETPLSRIAERLCKSAFPEIAPADLYVRSWIPPIGTPRFVRLAHHKYDLHKGIFTVEYARRAA